MTLPKPNPSLSACELQPARIVVRDRAIMAIYTDRAIDPAKRASESDARGEQGEHRENADCFTKTEPPSQLAGTAPASPDSPRGQWSTEAAAGDRLPGRQQTSSHVGGV
jgi:hypothetical protein